MKIFLHICFLGEFSKEKWHESGKIKFQNYGPIVRELMVPGVNIVHLYDPKDMEIVHRYEGKYNTNMKEKYKIILVKIELYQNVQW